MRILIDILHPAHVHFFRNFHAIMKERGHELFITARTKECSTDLLKRYALPYRLISTQKTGGVGLALEFLQRTVRLYRITRAFRPDVMTGIMGPNIAVVGALRNIPSVIFYDTEFAYQTNWFAYPLAHSVCTPDCYQGKVRGTHRTYAGYHEMAYLHPNRFIPDPEKLEHFGLAYGEPYSIVRFVSWKAIHDNRERGLTLAQKRRTIELMEQFGRVVISSEDILPPDLKDRKVSGPVEDIHHLMAYAQMIVGESATMSSEAAVLGVPAIFIATTGRGYTDDEEQRYGLVRHYTEQQFPEAVKTIQEMFSRGSPREFAKKARQKLLNEKIDVTAWMVDYFEDNFRETGK